MTTDYLFYSYQLSENAKKKKKKKKKRKKYNCDNLNYFHKSRSKYHTACTKGKDSDQPMDVVKNRK